jgi:hypothetical protein
MLTRFFKLGAPQGHLTPTMSTRTFKVSSSTIRAETKSHLEQASPAPSQSLQQLEKQISHLCSLKGRNVNGVKYSYGDPAPVEFNNEFDQEAINTVLLKLQRDYKALAAKMFKELPGISPDQEFYNKMLHIVDSYQIHPSDIEELLSSIGKGANPHAAIEDSSAVSILPPAKVRAVHYEPYAFNSKISSKNIIKYYAEAITAGDAGKAIAAIQCFGMDDLSIPQENNELTPLCRFLFLAIAELKEEKYSPVVEKAMSLKSVVINLLSIARMNHLVSKYIQVGLLNESVDKTTEVLVKGIQETLVQPGMFYEIIAKLKAFTQESLADAMLQSNLTNTAQDKLAQAIHTAFEYALNMAIDNHSNEETVNGCKGLEATYWVADQDKSMLDERMDELYQQLLKATKSSKFTSGMVLEVLNIKEDAARSIASESCGYLPSNSTDIAEVEPNSTALTVIADLD